MSNNIIIVKRHVIHDDTRNITLNTPKGGHVNVTTNQHNTTQKIERVALDAGDVASNINDVEASDISTYSSQYIEDKLNQTVGKPADLITLYRNAKG